MFEKPLNREWTRSPARHPELRRRFLALNILTFAFFSSIPVYIALIAGGFLTPVEPIDPGFPIVWALAALAVMEIPAMFLVGFLLVAQAEAAPDSKTAFERGQVALIVVLAFAEAIGLFGVAASLFGAPNSTAYAFVAFGVLMMTLVLLVFRPKVLSIVSTKLAEEEGSKQ